MIIKQEKETCADIISRARKNKSINITVDPPSEQVFNIKQIYINNYIKEVENRQKEMVGTPENVDLIVDYINVLLAPKPIDEHPYLKKFVKNWLWLSGFVGNGKTSSARALQRTFATVTNNKSLFKMYDAVDIVDMYESKDRFAFNKVQKCDYLIIDDIGVEVNLNKQQFAISEVLYYRYKFMLPTVFTSNLHDSQFRSIYDERIFDRIVEMSTKCEFKNKSFRKQ